MDRISKHISGQILGDRRNRELGELIAINNAMFQQNLGIILGGAAPNVFLPLLMIPAGLLMFPALGILETLDQARSHHPPTILYWLMYGGSAIIGLLLYMFVKLGLTSILLKISKGERPGFSEFKNNHAAYRNFLAANILVFLSVATGLVCFVVPGIILGCKLAFTPLLVLDRGMGPFEAMQESCSLTYGQCWKIFFASSAYHIINAIVSCIPLLGLAGSLVALPYYEMLICTIYGTRTGELAA
ncbi:MAG: hypothetical protein K2X77_26905 [Candidatus Obscuribacterales bacterium]|jgi:hypothetical protein|nr:hypothetical protein [Candidatus Obscuribacterales bacterium]